MSSPIVVQHVSKSFGKFVVLQDVSLSLERPSLVALLGPNGAGKTTLFQILMGLIPSFEGEAFLHGVNIKNPHARKKVSFLSDSFNFYPFYTVSQIYNFYAHIKSPPEYSVTQKKQQQEELWEAFGLGGLDSKQFKFLSKGQRERLGMACCFCGETSLVLLDEPFTGLDPLGVKDLRNYLLSFNQKGGTVFLNSHILAEIEKFCDTAFFLKDGQIVQRIEKIGEAFESPLEQTYSSLFSRN